MHFLGKGGRGTRKCFPDFSKEVRLECNGLGDGGSEERIRGREMFWKGGRGQAMHGV